MARLLRNLVLLLICADYFVGFGPLAAAAAKPSSAGAACGAAQESHRSSPLFASLRDSQTSSTADTSRSPEPALDRVVAPLVPLACDACRGGSLTEAPAQDRHASSNSLAVSGRLIPLRN